MTAVRRLGPDEWATLREVRLDALEDAPYAFHATRAEGEALTEADWRARIEDQACFVALEADRPVGLAMGGATRDADPTLRTLRGMWVAPAHRGTDTASRLVDEVVRWARGEGASTLVLWAFAPAVRARSFYARYGFAHVADQPPDDRHPEMARFELDLAGGDVRGPHL